MTLVSHAFFGLSLISYISILIACSPKRATGSKMATVSTKSLDLQFSSKRKTSFVSSAGDVIFAMDDFKVHAPLPEDKNTLKDDSDLYYVAFNDPNVIRDLSIIGEVVYKEEDRAVVRLSDDYSVMAANENMHRYNKGKCGSLIRINYDTVKAMATTTVSDESISHRDDVANLVSKVDANRIKASIQKLESFGTRNYQTAKGLEASLWVKDQGYGSALAGRQDVEVTTFDHGRWQQKTVIARIKGTKNPEKIVVVGSHLDSLHLNGGVQGTAPGADDNASGTATIMEAFRVLVASGARFDYTVEFHSYAAEEAGLLGSAEVAQRYRQQGKDVVAMVQADMTGYTSGDNRLIWLVSNNTSANLNSKLAELVKVYLPGVRTQQAPMNLGSSDHASWTKQGYPAAFPFENPRNPNPYIHSENDRIDLLDMGFAKLFGQLVVAYVGHYAGLQSDAGSDKTLDLNLALGDGTDTAMIYASMPSDVAADKLLLCRDSAEICRQGKEGMSLERWRTQADRIIWRSRNQQSLSGSDIYHLVGVQGDGRVQGMQSFRLISQ